MALEGVEGQACVPNNISAGREGEMGLVGVVVGACLAAAIGTLAQIFPGMDGEILGWVLEANQGDLGKSIEALLEMSGGQ